MKRILALIVALLMALSCAAVAETAESDSSLYHLAVVDPVISMNGEVLADLTGLDLELAVGLTDQALLGAILHGYVGENYDDNVFYLQAQLDQNGLSFGADGLSNLYSMDLTEYTGGVNPALYLGALPIHSSVRSLPQMLASMGSVKLTRADAVRQIAQSLAVESSGGAYTLKLTKENFAAMFLQAAAMADTAASAMGEDMGFAESAKQMNLEVELDGTANFADDGNIAMHLEGTLMMAGEDAPIPVSVDYNDDGLNAKLAVVLSNPENAKETIELNANVVGEAMEDGRVASETTVTFSTLEGNLVVLTSTAKPVAGSRQVDYAMTMDVEGTGAMNFSYSANTNGDGVGFDLAMSAEDEAAFYVSYAGEAASDASGNSLSGYIGFGATVDGESFDFESGLILADTLASVSDWAYDSSAAIDVESMDESQTSTLMMGAMGLIGTASTKLKENVPGIASYIDELVGEMMG